jgi:Uma2 family endonuclease
MAAPLPLPHGFWTVDDVLALPEGDQYEIIEGALHVSPMADREHHWIADSIGFALRANAPKGWLSIREIGVAIPDGYLGPDVTVLRPGVPRHDELTVDPQFVALVVEVESRSSRAHDRFTKPSLYAQVEIPWYWRVERTDPGPTAHLYRLNDAGTYDLAHSVKPGEVVDVAYPFPVQIAPATWALPDA